MFIAFIQYTKHVMFFFHSLREACQSLYTHKSRTLSMGFGVSWGIFILVLLLGIGNGFHNGISEIFKIYAEKTMVLWVNWHVEGAKPIPKTLASDLPEKLNFIEQSSLVDMHSSKVRYEDHIISRVSIIGFDDCYASLTDLPIQEGRFFTAHDHEAATHLCVLGLKIKKQLFGEASAIGKYIFLDTTCLQVVGVLDESNFNMYNVSRSVLVTNCFLKRLLPHINCYVDYLHLALSPEVDDNLAEAQLRDYFSRQLNINSKNERAFCIFNLSKHAAKWHKFFKDISIFTWIVGICFLITGIVGIANMMLVTIHERKQEMAIRRVLGGRSREIVAMILWEVAIVTFIAGIIGFTAGFSLIQLLNKWVIPLPQLKGIYLSQLTYPPEYIFYGLVLIFISSGFSSIIPAIRAIKIKPIEALSNE